MIIKWLASVSALALLGACATAPAAPINPFAAVENTVYDVLIRGGTIYDGSGRTPFVGDVGIRGDRIVYAGSGRPATAPKIIDARGLAVSPGFINMLSWATESLLVDPRGQSDLRQGVTLEVMGEGWSMGPLTAEMKAQALKRQGDFTFPIEWTTLGDYLRYVERKGTALNIASFVGATTVRQNVLGERDVDPDPAQLDRMRALVRQAMEEGAMGVGSSLIYPPASFAETDELVALVTEAGKCGGMYISHMRSEGDRLAESVDELIEISHRSGAPAEIYHLKQAGKANWGKLDQVIARVEAARAAGLRITADMYTYTAGGTGVAASMPPWVQDGGVDAMLERLKDPAIVARIKRDMRQPGPLLRRWQSDRTAHHCNRATSQKICFHLRFPSTVHSAYPRSSRFHQASASRASNHLVHPTAKTAKLSKDLSLIRNFSIIAHIDHGKSTLADRLILATGGLTEREMTRGQVLDNMEIEQERGITIKAQTVRLEYKAADGQLYELNLMDTPGHVDFAYEVSRSLAACEGALLVVDAAQGVEAQTLANVYQSIEQDHEIVPVINKIDLPAADPDGVKQEIEEIIGLDATDAVLTSAKAGIGITEVLQAIVDKIPPPKGDREAPLKAMLVDSWYDPYLGVVILVRVKDGVLKKGQQIKFMAAGTTHLVDRVGCMRPKIEQLPELAAGEIGFITAQIKEVAETRVGDTITDAKRPTPSPLPGFKEVQPVVFCGLFPVDAADFEKLRDSLYKLRLNDASFSFETESSAALGFGFRCGFLGLLHLEIIQERLTREYDLDLITTAPSVVYKMHLTHSKNEPAQVIELHNPADMPDPNRIEMIEEPWIEATIYTPDEYLGSILKLCQDRRGIQKGLTYVGSGSHARAQLKYELPLNEVVFDFYDRLKSISRGYASFDYEQIGHREGDLVKMSILVNEEPVDALSMITHRGTAESRGRGMCERLKDLIPRHMFKIPIQAAIGGKVIARETISALRKDVTAKCYGGDATRKRKLLEKQKKGKAKMREYGNVSIPQEAFIAALRMGDEG